MITGAIFDLDGTLLDSMGIWEGLGLKILKKLGCTPEEDIETVLKLLNVRQFSAYIKEHYHIDKTPDELSTMMYAEVEDFYYYTAKEKEGVIPFLRRLKKEGVKIVLATASESYFVKKALERLGLDTYIEKIFTCTQVGYAKDRPEIYRAALEYLGGDKQKTVVFEDVLHALTTAKGDGFYTVGIYDEYAIRKEEIPTMCDVFLKDYLHTRDFWEFAAAL